MATVRRLAQKPPKSNQPDLIEQNTRQFKRWLNAAALEVLDALKMGMSPIPFQEAVDTALSTTALSLSNYDVQELGVFKNMFCKLALEYREIRKTDNSVLSRIFDLHEPIEGEITMNGMSVSHEQEIRARYTKKLGDKEYLMVAGRILLFRLAHPKGVIDTELISADGEFALFKCRILDSDGAVLATGHARAILAQSKNYGGRIFEKAETAAIGRALAHAGFGTEAAGDDIEDEMEHLADSPVQGKPKQEKSKDGSTPLHWSKVQHNVDTIIAIYGPKYGLNNLMDMEAVIGRLAIEFKTGKVFGEALDAAAEKESIS